MLLSPCKEMTGDCLSGASDSEPVSCEALALDIFDILKSIKDPERPETLEELGVLCETGVKVSRRETPQQVPPPPPPPSAAPSASGAAVSAKETRQPQFQATSYWIRVEFTPTVPHCSLATLIGLCIRTKLEREFPEQYKLDINLKLGTHSTEAEINKQINDKERIAAALENSSLRELVENCINC